MPINQFRETATDTWVHNYDVTNAQALRLWIYRNVDTTRGYASGIRTLMHADQPAVLSQILDNISANATVQMMRREYWDKMEITNTESSTVSITRYVIKARKDIPVLNFTDAGGSIIYGLGDALRIGFAQNNAGLGSALGDGAVRTANASFTIALEQSLFDNPRFCEQFKVLKVRTRKLTQGEKMSLLIKRKRPRIIKKTSMLLQGRSTTVNNTYAWAVKKGQVFQVFALIGSIAEGPGTAGNTIGLSGARVIIQRNTTVEYTWMEDRSRAYGATYGIAGFSPETAYVPKPVQEVYTTNVVQAPVGAAAVANSASSYVLGKTYVGGAGPDTDAAMPDVQ